MNIKMSLEINVFFLESTVNISIIYHCVNNQFELIPNSMWFRYCHREFSINQLSLSGMDFWLFYWKLTQTIIFIANSPWIHYFSRDITMYPLCYSESITNPLSRLDPKFYIGNIFLRKQPTKLFSPIFQKKSDYQSYDLVGSSVVSFSRITTGI